MMVTCPICHRVMLCDNIEKTETEVIYTYTCNHWRHDFDYGEPPLTFQIKGIIVCGEQSK